MDFSKLIIRPLTRAEFDIAVEWAAVEGWNPGLGDAGLFWNTDPDGYLGAEYGGEIVATGSVVSYDGHYGFMGIFIVKPGLRGQGIGSRLWFHRRDFLSSRLHEGAAIGMDGVFDMQGWYHRGGFEFTHRNLRMEGVGKAAPDVLEQVEVVPLAGIPFEEVAAYDKRCFGFGQERFLRP
jgi:GNAT superfamily N-acetyltransferase